MKHSAMIRRGMLSVLLMMAPCVAVHASTVYIAILTGVAENPSNPSTGSGTAIVEYDELAHTLKLDVAFHDLLSADTAAHIHCCVASPGNVGVATSTPSFPGFPLGATSGTYLRLFDLTDTSSFSASFISASGGTVNNAEDALASGLVNGQAYFNIHTSNYPGGEIRGFFAPATVPVPAAVWLFGSGLLGLIGCARRTRG